MSTHISRKLETHGYAIVAKPQPTDARSSRLERFHGEGWLAAGDAAIAFDPLSSQGILSALYSGLKSGQAVVGCLGGDCEVLLQYDVSILKCMTNFCGIACTTMAPSSVGRRACFGRPEESPDDVNTSAYPPFVALNNQKREESSNGHLFSRLGSVRLPCHPVRVQGQGSSEPPDNHPPAPAFAAGLPQSAAHSRP
jgi:hypothetical protein